MTIIGKLVRKETITDEDIEEMLYEICDDTHASCDDNCPIYEVLGGPLNPDKSDYGCECFKSGQIMLRHSQQPKTQQLIVGI